MAIVSPAMQEMWATGTMSQHNYIIVLQHKSYNINIVGKTHM